MKICCCWLVSFSVQSFAIYICCAAFHFIDLYHTYLHMEFRVIPALKIHSIVSNPFDLKMQQFVRPFDFPFFISRAWLQFDLPQHYHLHRLQWSTISIPIHAFISQNFYAILNLRRKRSPIKSDRETHLGNWKDELRNSFSLNALCLVACCNVDCNGHVLLCYCYQ